MSNRFRDWEDAFVELESRLHYSYEEIVVLLEEQYDDTENSLIGVLVGLFALFAAGNALTYQMLHQNMTKREFSYFQTAMKPFLRKAAGWTVPSELIRLVEKYGSAKRLNRAKATQAIITAHMADLFTKTKAQLDAKLQKAYEEAYNRTAYEVQKGLGVGSRVDVPSADRIKEILRIAWTPDGIHYSKRLDINAEKLANVLSQEIELATIRGDTMYRAIDNVSDKLDISRRAAKKIVMTEAAYFAAEAQKASFAEQGIKQYQFVAILDNRTTQTCRRMNGKVFKMSDFKPGTTAPPMHCYCRSHTRPYFRTVGDMEKLASTDSGPSSFKVRSNMSYEDWYKASH